MQYICWFQDIRATDVELVGGKGSNLGGEIMSIASATQRVLDGQMVMVDGDRGCVYLKTGSEA